MPQSQLTRSDYHDSRRPGVFIIEKLSLEGLEILMLECSFLKLKELLRNPLFPEDSLHLCVIMHDLSLIVFLHKLLLLFSNIRSSHRCDLVHVDFILLLEQLDQVVFLCFREEHGVTAFTLELDYHVIEKSCHLESSLLFLVESQLYSVYTRGDPESFHHCF